MSKFAVISDEVVIPSYPVRACQHVNVKQTVSQTVQVRWDFCK